MAGLLILGENEGGPGRGGRGVGRGCGYGWVRSSRIDVPYGVDAIHAIWGFPNAGHACPGFRVRISSGSRVWDLAGSGNPQISGVPELSVFGGSRNSGFSGGPGIVSFGGSESPKMAKNAVFPLWQGSIRLFAKKG